MDRITNLDLLVGAGGLVIVAYLFTSRRDKRIGHLPPGPRPLPLIGNLLDLPKGKEWEHWIKHKGLYGPISTVKVFGQRIIILNDKRLAIELLDKRSAIYSDRPTLEFAGEMLGWVNALGMMPYNNRFRAFRKNIYQVIGTRSAVSHYHKLIEIETRRLLLRILESPDKLLQHVRTDAGAIILKVSYGYTIERDGKDPLVDIADEVMSQFSMAGQPGAWLVDILPFLKNMPSWMPGAGFKRIGAAWHNNLMELTEKPFAFVKRQMSIGAETPSFTSELLSQDEQDDKEDHDNIVKWSAASLYAGGADTTVSAVYSFFLAMALHPEAQKRAQEEIDRVIGFERLPTFDDRPHLPYVEALVKEVLRWNPVAPLGLPHQTSSDDMFEGYYIPKQSIIIANIWQYTHDPDTYDKPLSFNPERFLGSKPEPDPRDLVFGFGRRICPGKELADASTFMSIAMSLAALNISKAKDESGNAIEPLCDYCPGIISHPKEFACSVLPRTPKAAVLIRSIEEEHPFEPSDAAALLRS